MPALLMAAGVPFWESKPAAEWSMDQVNTLLTDSPWAEMVEAGRKDLAPAVQVYLATAEPIEQAEQRARAARGIKLSDPLWQEYVDYLAENKGKIIVLAIRATKAEDFLDGKEASSMEKESYLKIGKRKYKIIGQFPPSSGDPYERMIFPRDVDPGDRSLVFDLYVPGTGSPYRHCEFPLKDLVYHGKPCY
jgi:hypothetical protein